MKWLNKRMICMVFALILPWGTGCAEKKVDTPKVTQEPNVTPLSKEKSIDIYTIDEENGESVSETVYLMDGEKVNAKNIMNQVIELFSMHSIFIQLDKVTGKKDTLYVSFKKKGAPAKDVSANVEEIILESIAKSLLDNLDDYTKVIFQVEGGPYKSDNMTMKKDEVYWWK